MGSGNFRDISYICLQQDILVTSQGFISPDSFFFVLGGGPWQGLCLETKRILAYAEFLSRENDLSGTKWGAHIRPRQNITLLPKHGGIVAAVWRIFVKNMRATRQNR